MAHPNGDTQNGDTEKVRWFASPRDRDGTIFMILIFVFAVYYIEKFDMKFADTLIAMGFGIVISPITSIRDYLFGKEQ